MTARDLIAELSLLGPQDQNVIFTFIAEHLYELRLLNGQRILDLMDFKVLLRELAEAWRLANFEEGMKEATKVHQMRSKVTRMPQQRWEGHCPNCGHVHIDDAECNFPIGGGRRCRCERNVVA